jgi:hypothetical protein
MKKNYILSFILILSLSINEINAQTEWTGPTVTIAKDDYADWTQPANQDALTANVILTRANNRGIFNIVQETEYDNVAYTSPLDTAWAIGTIADGVGELTFDTWDNTHEGDPSSIIDIDLVLHLITDNIYVDMKIIAWTSGSAGGGGGFVYERSTDQSLSISEIELGNSIKLFPNPSTEFIQISGLSKPEKYTIYNIIGSEISYGKVTSNEVIDIKNFANGLYFLKFNNGKTLKFLKE